MTGVKRILYPTDLSDYSLATIGYVNSLTKLYSAQLHVLHVIDRDLPLAFHTVEFNSETMLRDSKKHAEELLDRLIWTHFRNQVNIVSAFRRGEASKEIVKYVNEREIDLIIMSTHGRTGLAHVLMGSVAEKVVRHSPVPVLTVKPAEMQSILVEQQDIDEQLHIQ